jgi:PAS domain S-box-containing protein
MPQRGEIGLGADTDVGSGELAFDRFLELVPDAMLLADSSGRIVSLNAQAEELFGYTRLELLGEQVEVLVPTHLAEAHIKQRDGYFENPRPRPLGLGLGLSGRRKDGSEFPAGISLSAIETAGGTLAAAAVRDLTEHVEAEEDRKELEAVASEARAHQARRLESVGELAGGLAHDFNNLLAVILNNAELALHKTDERAGISDELNEIHGAAEHGAKLTRQLLIFSRRQVVTKEPVDLNAIVTGMEVLLHGSIGKSIELGIQLAEELPSVLADKSQMEQVILNLAINSRDAMPSGGRLRIDTKVVALDAHYARTRPDVTPGRYVRLTVADDGAGMPRDVVTRAFEERGNRPRALHHLRDRQAVRRGRQHLLRAGRGDGRARPSPGRGRCRRAGVKRESVGGPRGGADDPGCRGLRLGSPIGLRDPPRQRLRRRRGQPWGQGPEAGPGGRDRPGADRRGDARDAGHRARRPAARIPPGAAAAVHVRLR